jgi:hypothetical protein
MNRRFALTCVCLALSGLALGKGFLAFSRLSPEEMDQRVAASPIIKLEGKKTFEPRPTWPKVEIHFKKFGAFTAHDGVEDAEWHYVMGEPSKPKWKYTRVGEIVIFRRDRSDPHAILAFKKAAAAMGGDAVINVMREPVVLEGTYDYATSSSGIQGYQFYGDVVRRKD